MDSSISPPDQGVHRGKACFSCIRAKRRCDKRLPSCRRCADRDEPCAYPSARPYRRQKPRPSSGGGPAGSFDVAQLCSAAGDAAVSSTSSHAGLTAGDPGDAIPYIDGSLFPFLEQLVHDGPSVPAPQPLLSSAPWFLQSDTWGIVSHDPGGPDSQVDVSYLKGFIKCIRRWLWRWVTEAHCLFIHRELYRETGLPPCVQDAYASLAAYVVKTDRNEEVVAGLVEDKADALLRRYGALGGRAGQPPAGQQPAGAPLTTREHLARVQALVVYQFVDLYDGDIRQRARGERRMATLQDWIEQLWESAKTGASLQVTFGQDGDFFARASARDHPADRRWRDWVLAESVRRTWMVARYMQTIYLTLRDGQVSCPGSIVCTVRQGLWEARTSASWCSMVEDRDPLFMRLAPPNRLFTAAQATEVDVFGLSMLSIMRDACSVNNWVSGSSELDLKTMLEK